LYHLGLNHSYHSEEVVLFVWSRVLDDWWRQPHMWDRYHVLERQGFDRHILGEWYKTPHFTDAFSRCRVDAMSFDGLSRMFLPVYEMSPGAKVIILQWRTYEEQKRSYKTFMRRWHLHGRFGYPGVHAWTYVLLHILEPLSGNPVIKLLEEGGPPVNQVLTPITLLYLVHVTAHRIVMHVGQPTVGWMPAQAWRFDWFYDMIRAQVPAQDRFEFDFRRHAYEDLCSFLGIDPCPKKGPLPRVSSALPVHLSFPRECLVWLPLVAWCHWFNWLLLVRLPRAIWYLVGPCVLRCGWPVLRTLVEGPLGRRAKGLAVRLPDLGSAALASVEQQAEAFDLAAFFLSLLRWITWPVGTFLWLITLPFRLLLRLVKWVIRTLLTLVWWVVATPYRILKWLILAPFRLLAFLIRIPLSLFALGRPKREADSKDKAA